MRTLTEQILDQCSSQGLCPLDRLQFGATFAGGELAIQLRAALDFAQAHDLAFARSLGDQRFIFSRLPKAYGVPRNQKSPPRGLPRHQSRAKQRSKVPVNRPYGRSF